MQASSNIRRRICWWCKKKRLGNKFANDKIASCLQCTKTEIDNDNFSKEEKFFTRKTLLSWYKSSRRKMPWRGDEMEGYPQTPQCSAYGTWVSEIMLQQTRVETVIAYWFKWMDRFPSTFKQVYVMIVCNMCYMLGVLDLAAATPDEVNSYWAGLGYYRRAQNLLKGAQVVRDTYNGALPTTVAELRTIPGIGPYTAGAIASVAYNQPECVVDGNVIRVLSRLRTLRSDGKELEKKCWEIAGDIIDSSDPGSFNQALMEFGATVCKPQNPLCIEGKPCPLSSICMAHQLSSGMLAYLFVCQQEEYD
jgi:A/G-specific adenine glycosylase